MPIRAALFDLGNTLVAYYQPSDFMPLLRRSLDACRRTLGHPPLSHEAQTALVHKALELNQERGIWQCGRSRSGWRCWGSRRRRRCSWATIPFGISRAPTARAFTRSC